MIHTVVQPALGLATSVQKFLTSDLDRAGEQVAVVRQARGERWAIVEAVQRPAFGQLERRLEGVNLAPELEDLDLLLREVDLVAHCADPTSIRANAVAYRYIPAFCG